MIATDIMRARKAALGDEQAFEEIYREYRRQILWHVNGIVRNIEDAEDITQEVFTKAYLAMGTYVGRAGLGRWLRQIATNTCIDRMRKRAVQTISWPVIRRRDGDQESMEFPDESPGPLDVVESRDARDAILTQVQELPEHYRKVVYLYDIAERQGQEVAAEIGHPVGTVKSRLHRAHNMLRATLTSSSDGLAGVMAGRPGA